MCGECEVARHDLGIFEYHADNHHIIEPLNTLFFGTKRVGTRNLLIYAFTWIKEGFIAKDECASAMSAYQKIHDESESAKRDKAEADLYNTIRQENDHK